MLALYLQKMSCVNLSARIIDICYHAQLINFFIKLSRFSYFIIGTENGLIKSPNTAEKRHTDFSFLFNPASLLIRASNPGLSDSRVLFFVMAIVSHTHPKDSCWTLLKSHAHSFKALCWGWQTSMTDLIPVYSWRERDCWKWWTLSVIV